MRNTTNLTTKIGAFLVPILFASAMIGCGGAGNATLSNNSPNPGASPTPTPTTPSSVVLKATPASLGFGSQVLNTSTTLTVKITNSGSSAVTISQDTVSGSGFTVGVTTPITLNAATSVNVPVVFKPGAAGAVNGSLSFISNGTTALSVPLTGTGFAALAHSVDLSWLASSSSPLQGYNVYRGTISGGPYSKVSSTLSPATLAFTDTTPVSGKQYFYVVTALNTSGAESVASSEVAVTIPIP